MAMTPLTPKPLLRLSGSAQPLLGLGLGRQPGPVTIALAAMQAADPDRQRIRELRRRIANRIEADIALLDALDGDPDLEPSLGSIDATAHSNYMHQEVWSLGSGQDREAGDDNGIADWGGEHEQCRRFQAMGGNLNEYVRRYA